MSRTLTFSSVPGVGKGRALGQGPEPGQAGRSSTQCPAQRRGAPACSLQEPGHPREPAGGGRPARHHQGPWQCGGSGRGHHRGLAEF